MANNIRIGNDGTIIREDAAVEQFRREETAEQRSRDAPACFDRGCAAWNNGDFAGAVVAFHEAVDGDPSNAQYKDYLAKAEAAVEKKQRQDEEAKQRQEEREKASGAVGKFFKRFAPGIIVGAIVGALIGGGLVSCSSIRGYIDDTGRAAIIVFTIGGALLCAIGVFIGSANPEEKDMIGFLAGGCLGAIVVAIIGAIGGAIIGAIVDDFNGVYGFFGGAILGAIVGAIGGGIGSVQSD